MRRVAAARPLDSYRLEIAFDDGVHGIIDLEQRLFGPVFAPLRDWGLFSQVFVDDFGAVCWPNGADLAPDAMYEQLRTSAEAASR